MSIQSEPALRLAENLFSTTDLCLLEEWFPVVSVIFRPSTEHVPPLLMECAEPSSATPCFVSQPRSSTCATTGQAKRWWIATAAASVPDPAACR